MPYSMPNNNTYTNIPPLESLYVLFGMVLSAVNPKEFTRFQDFVRQNPDFGERYPQTFPSPEPTHAGSSAAEETVVKQKLIDKVFEYVAPSGVVTAVLASGELVGSTIWGISKYVSKDIIWDTLGATTAAVILQSAELVGYRNEVQKFFGIKPAEKRATVAIKMGSKLGQAIGAVAGTSLTLLAEPWILPVAPVLAPYLPFAGLFIGGVAGDVIGAGLGAGFNNLLLSTIGTVPASYKGIKQKGGKFADRIKNSRAEKRKVKEAKAVPKVKKEAEENVVTLNVEGVGSSKVPSAQLLLEASNAIPANPPYPNAAEQQKSAAQEQKEAEENVVTLNVEGVGSSKVPSSQKSPEASNAVPANPPHPNVALVPDPQTKVKKTVTPLSQPIAPKNQDSTPKNTKTKTNGQSVYEARREEVTEEGGEWQKVLTKKEKIIAQQQKKQQQLEAQTKNNGPTGYPDVKIRFPKNPRVGNNKLENVEKQNNTQCKSNTFTNKILPTNAVQNARKQGEQNQGQSYTRQQRNRTERNSQSPWQSRSNNY